MHKNIMATGSRDRPPILATRRYAQWRSWFLRYIDTRPNGDALRKCILKDPYYKSSKPHKSYAPTSKASLPTRSHATTRYKGKEIAKPITPPSESASEEDSDPEQAQRDKDMQKNLALIAKYFKKIYKPTNNNLRTSSNTRNKNVDTTPRYKNDNQTGQFGNQRAVNVAGARETECKKPKRVKDSTYHKEKMLLCKQAEKGVQLQAEQSDWLADTEVPNADSGTDAEPLEQVQYDTDDNVFANDIQHFEQFESIRNTCVVETGDSNVIPDSPDICFAFVHELKQEMHADLKYVESLEDEIDELESDKAEFSNMYDMLLQECVLNDITYSYLQSSSDLDENIELQCLYLHKVRIVQLILFIVDSGCTKHMTGNLSLLCNFVEKYLGTVRFGNDQFALILGYGDLVQGNITINRVYYVEETTSSTPICLMAKASPTHAWLWHRRLSYLNFDYINLLSKKDVVIGLPKLKYTWTLFLCSKDETPEVLKDFLTMIQRNLQAPVISVRTDRGTEFLNKTLNAFFKEEGIEHQTSTPRTLKRTALSKDETALSLRLLKRCFRLLNFLYYFGLKQLFDEIKEMSETSVANDTSGLVPQRQKASDYDNPDPAPELQNVSPSADTTVPSQQELDLLFGPLYDEFFNDGTSRVNKSSSPTDNSIQKDTLPSTHIQPTPEPTTPTNVHAEENNDNQAEFTNPFCTPVQENAESLPPHIVTVKYAYLQSTSRFRIPMDKRSPVNSSSWQSIQASANKTTTCNRS
ncbi:retrovirus-related pol polyprotein from transposon TNT 1-94 [Tanacetum coccineum]